MSIIEDYKSNLAVLESTIRRINKLEADGDSPLKLEIEDIYLTALIKKHYRLLDLAVAEDKNFYRSK